MEKLKAHLVTLPRWFALPAAACGVALGGILSEAEGWLMAVAILCGAFVMAWAHSMNTLLDYSWTGLDKGTEQERSRPKEYTAGQQPIATGILKEWEVLGNALLWLAISAGLAWVISNHGSPWVWLPWGLAVLCTFWYSQAKKWWHPEIPLGLGFSTFAVWLGMSASGSIDWSGGFLASLPLLMLWGGLAEHIDQNIDWEPNWPKGGRSLGMLVGKLGIPLRWSVVWGTSIVYLLQIFVVSVGFLSPWTGLTFVAVVPLTLCGTIIDTDLKRGVLWGLAGIFTYQVLLVVGQAI